MKPLAQYAPKSSTSVQDARTTNARRHGQNRFMSIADPCAVDVRADLLLVIGDARGDRDRRAYALACIGREVKVLEERGSHYLTCAPESVLFRVMWETRR
jgi:hypothetical protein